MNGYSFAPLPDRVARRLRAGARLDRRVEGTVSGKLELVFRTEQPLHVGAGHKVETTKGVARAAVRVYGRPGVPGSSLKGMIRARFEALTRSCLTLSRGELSVRSSSFQQVKRGAFSPSLHYQDLFQACGRAGLHTPLCPACALFGQMGRRGRITFTDLYTPVGSPFQIEPMRAQFAPNIHHVGKFRVTPDSKFEVYAPHGRKFGRGLEEPPPRPQFQLVEVIPAGTELRGELRLFNATFVELGALIAALGVSPGSALKLGGGKGLGFGRTRLRGIDSHLVDHRGRPVASGPSEWRSALLESDDHWPDGERALIEIHQGGC